MMGPEESAHVLTRCNKSGETITMGRALEYCDRISSKGNNYLKRVARFLPNKTKYHLFCATYAAMRVIDDAVDEQFLARPEDERSDGRQAMLGTVDKWLTQSEQAAAGAYRTISSSFEPFVFEALNLVLRGTQLGLAPWRKLATSMRRDVREEGFQTWNDFLSYCEGACVAPATIFLYILGCDVDREKNSTISWPEPPDHYARDMAIFCYIVHILRDLPRDARQNSQILTIPGEFLSAAKIRTQEFATAVISENVRVVEPVLHRLIDLAQDYEARAEEQLAKLGRLLGKREYRIVWVLHKLYSRTFRVIRNDFAKQLEEARQAT